MACVATPSCQTNLSGSTKIESRAWLGCVKPVKLFGGWRLLTLVPDESTRGFLQPWSHLQRVHGLCRRTGDLLSRVWLQHGPVESLAEPAGLGFSPGTPPAGVAKAHIVHACCTILVLW